MLKITFLAAVLAVGCSQGVPAAVDHQAAASVRTAALTEPVPTAMPRVRKAIDATAAAAHPALGDTPSAIQAQTLAAAELPVLLPQGGPWLGAGIATAGRDWYVLSARHSDLTVVVQGDRVATLDPDMAPPDWRAPSWQEPLVTHNEGLVDATFLAFGASYVVTVECAEPERDTRCTEDAFAADLVASLRRWQPAGVP